MIKHVWAEDWSEEVVPDKVTVIPIGFETNIENLYHVLHEVCINYRAVHTYDDVQKKYIAATSPGNSKGKIGSVRSYLALSPITVPLPTTLPLVHNITSRW